MQIEFFDKYIDPTGKNILTPDALGKYLGIPALIVTVPEFRPGETFEMPVATAGIVFSYARIIYGGLARYYFVTEADPADLDSNIINLRFSMDWAHTLQIGQPVRSFMPQSVLTRSTLANESAYAYDSERYLFDSMTPIGNTGNHQGLRVVAIFAVKRAESIFTAAEYSYIGVISNDVYIMLDQAVDAVKKLANAKVYTELPAPEQPSDNCSPVAFYLVPDYYTPSIDTGNSTKYGFIDRETRTTVEMWQPNTDLFANKLTHVDIEPASYGYEIGNGSNRITIKTADTAATIQTTFTLCGYPGEFSLTSDIEGTRIDLTESCAIPFVVANENEISTQVNKRNLALLGAGVTIASGVASQNAALVYGGAMTAFSSAADINSTSFPTIIGSGSLFKDSLLPGKTADPLVLYRYLLTSNSRWKNSRMGAVTMYPITGFPVFGGEFEYVEGDLYPIPRNYFESLNIVRMHDIFSDGVRIYTSASVYRP